LTLPIQRKVVAFLSVVEARERKEKITQSAYLLLKLEQCLQVKELLLYQEKRKLRAEEDQVRNLTTLGLN
jgi:hypothetical protein